MFFVEATPKAEPRNKLDTMDHGDKVPTKEPAASLPSGESPSKKSRINLN